VPHGFNVPGAFSESGLVGWFWCICGQQSVLGRDVSSSVTLVSDGKPREIRHLRFAACRSSVRQRVFSGPKSPDAPGPVLEPGSPAPFAALPYPRYCFDFEGIDLPVPRWIGVGPYEQIPFQWSCHIERAPDTFEHVEFLDLRGNDPSIPCIERMLKAAPPDGPGPIFVYYQTYEAGRLRELTKRHPRYRPEVDQYLARLVDLHPIVRANYYHPALRGSFSIKAVLPTIAPDLDTGTLNEITDGTAAQVAYLYAAFDARTTPERKAELRDRLLTYCKQDTWAMVEVAHFLQRLARPVRVARNG
jgi:uncharacterized protein DUF2779